MKKFKVLMIVAFVFAIGSAFATRSMMTEDHASYYNEYSYCTVGPQAQYPWCSTTNTGQQCTAVAPDQTEYPAYYYDRPNAYCLMPLYTPW